MTGYASPDPESTPATIPQALIGRQPILDRGGKVEAYELLFRPDTDAAALPFEGNRATATVIVNALTEFSLDQLVGPHRAYINFTGEMLQDETALLLPKERIVIEILEDVTVNAELIEAVTSLTQQGYQVALDDFEYAPQWEPIMVLASTVKIDVLALDAAKIAEHVELLKRYDVTLLAEKVETLEQHAQLMELGFDLFQGYYYAKPNIVKRDRIPENHVAAVQLLATLYDDSATQEDIVALVSQDASLSYRLLRYFNSAFFSLPQKVDSIRRALIFFGLDMLRKWVGLLAIANVGGKSPVLLQNALVRAHMCEGLAKLKQLPDPESYFTVGLFSILDSLLDTPMETVTASMPLSEEIVDALVKCEGDRGAALRCVCAYEEARWADVEYGGIDRKEIGKLYLDSIEWAFEAASGI